MPDRCRFYGQSQVSHKILEAPVHDDARSLVGGYRSLEIVALQDMRHAVSQVADKLGYAPAGFNGGLRTDEGGKGVIAGREGKYHPPAFLNPVEGLHPVPVTGKVKFDILAVLKILHEVIVRVFLVDSVDFLPHRLVEIRLGQGGGRLVPAYLQIIQVDSFHRLPLFNHGNGRNDPEIRIVPAVNDAVGPDCFQGRFRVEHGIDKLVALPDDVFGIPGRRH